MKIMMKNQVTPRLVILAVGLVSLSYWLNNTLSINTISDGDNFSEGADKLSSSDNLSVQQNTENKPLENTIIKNSDESAQEANYHANLEKAKESNLETEVNNAIDDQIKLPPLEDWTGEEFDRYLAQFNQAAVESEIAFNNTQKYRELVVQKAAELNNLFSLEEIACNENACISTLNWFGEDLNKLQSSFFATPEINSGDIAFQHFERQAAGDAGTILLVFTSQ